MMGSAEEPEVKPRKMHKLKTKIAAKAKSLFAKKQTVKEEKEIPREDPKMKIITPASISNNLDRTRLLLMEKKLKSEEEKKRIDVKTEADRVKEEHTEDKVKQKQNASEGVKKEKNREEDEDFVFVSVKPKNNSQSSSDSGFLDSSEFVKCKQNETAEEAFDTKMFEFAKQETVERLRKTNECKKRSEQKTIERQNQKRSEQKTNERHNRKTAEREEDEEAALIEELVKLEISIDRIEDSVIEEFKKLNVNDDSVAEKFNKLNVDDDSVAEKSKKLTVDDDSVAEKFKKLNVDDDSVAEEFKKLNVDEDSVAEKSKKLNVDDDSVAEDFKKLDIDKEKNEEGKIKHMRSVLITRLPTKKKDFKMRPGPYQQQINKVNELTFSGGQVLVQETVPETAPIVFDTYRPPAHVSVKEVEDCMNQVMAVLPLDVIDTMLENQSVAEQHYDWSSPEHNNYSPYDDNRSPESCFSSPSQQLPNFEISQDFEYYSQSPEHIRDMLRASPSYAVSSLSNDGLEKTAFTLQNFEKLLAFDDATNFDGAHILDDTQKVFDGTYMLESTQKVFNVTHNVLDNSEKVFDGTHMLDDSRKVFDGTHMDNSQKVFNGAHILDNSQNVFNGAHILDSTQKVFNVTHNVLDNSQKVFDGTHMLDNSQKVFDGTHMLDNSQKVFDPAYDGTHFDPVFNDLTCQDVLNDDFILGLNGSLGADPLTPPRSNDSHSPPSPSYTQPKYAEYNSPQSEDFAMSPNVRIQKTERTYTFASSPDRDSTTPTIKLDKLEEEKEEKLKRHTPINMSMFKKQMQALAAKYAAMPCCQKERPHPKEALVRHLEKCSKDQRTHMTLTLARLDIAHVFQLLYYRVLPALESPAEGEGAADAAREHVDFALLSLACQRLLAEKPEIFLDEDYGLALLSRAAVRCASRPELARYLVWCVRRALTTRPPGTGPVFTQTDMAGDNLAGALARLGDSHAGCLAELVAREPRDRPLLDLQHRNTEGYSALHLACQLHNTRSGPHTTHTVHVLMTHGGVPVTLPDNKSGNTALHCAVDAGGCDLQLVLTLFQDVPPNKRRSLAYCKNAGMKTPIELARSAARTRSDYPAEVLDFLKKCRT